MNMEAEKEKVSVSFDISPNGFHINIIFSNPANCLFSNFSEVSHLEFGLSFSEGNNLGETRNGRRKEPSYQYKC